MLANRTVATISVEIVRAGKLPEDLTIPSGDSQPVFFQSSLQVRFGDMLKRHQFALQAGNAYFFVRGADGEALRLEQIGLGEEAQDAKTLRVKNQKDKKNLPGSATKKGRKKVPDTFDPVTITVKILADDNEPTHRRIWEPKLRQRIAEASEILERQSGVRLKVVEVTTWKSNKKQRNFSQTLREFERNVKTQPAQLAIGFSSQYQAARGRSHLGVTRWPMHTHILLRERSRNLLEAEKLELLVHELGHYLGASHSPEPQSVMRPMLTRGQQRGVGSRIQFDPVNALIIAMIGEEMRQHGVRDVRKISKPTIQRLRQIYGILKQAMPHDPAAQQYLRILNLVSAPKQVANTLPKSAALLLHDTRKVLSHLVTVAQQQQAASEKISSDELTNLYVQQAALSATNLRSGNAKQAMLLALGIFMDDTHTLRTAPLLGTFIGRVESEQQYSERLEIMGNPTMRERSDLTKHFFVSAHLVVAGGKLATVSAGLAKEMKDSQGGTGFSFIDMAANRAGIVFAEHVLAGKISLDDLARKFHVDDYLPTLRGLEEGLTADDLQKNYGGAGQPTLAEEIDQIEQRVLDLPAYDRPE
ncbi:MAG: matrixin family metalloprotease [Planctomycetes bacterium]|nr:matrixin family metalloprotease [Planctomycetota bacterium]